MPDYIDNFTSRIQSMKDKSKSTSNNYTNLDPYDVASVAAGGTNAYKKLIAQHYSQGIEGFNVDVFMEKWGMYIDPFDFTGIESIEEQSDLKRDATGMKAQQTLNQLGVNVSKAGIGGRKNQNVLEDVRLSTGIEFENIGSQERQGIYEDIQGQLREAGQTQERIAEAGGYDTFDLNAQLDAAMKRGASMEEIDAIFRAAEESGQIVDLENQGDGDWYPGKYIKKAWDWLF